MMMMMMMVVVVVVMMMMMTTMMTTTMTTTTTTTTTTIVCKITYTFYLICQYTQSCRPDKRNSVPQDSGDRWGRYYILCM